jgi:hypothetical protein
MNLASTVTIDDYKMMLLKQDKDRIADFVFKRLTERYIVPLENVPIKYKNGFSIMANCCLLIETYESFRQGWDDTIAPNKIPFKSFFDRESEFLVFKTYSKDFYFNVRCGILHQGETTQGWTITRKISEPLLNTSTKRINANKFLACLRTVLENYMNTLKSDDWDSNTWIKCREKLNFIITNC